MDEKNGFLGKFGLTTAEQGHREFAIDYNRRHECLWNGPTWPYATSVTLTAYANAINTLQYYEEMFGAINSSSMTLTTLNQYFPGIISSSREDMIVMS
jgi:hypothetical protein